MTRTLEWNDPETIPYIHNLLDDQKVILGSSDTVIGLLAPLTQQGRDTLDKLKQRKNMPYLVLVSSVEKAQQFSDAFQGGIVKKLAEQHWPGPLTLIVPAKETLPEYMQSASRGIAIRVPDHAGLQRLLKKVEGLFSTSANLSGQPVPSDFAAVDPTISNQIAAIVTEKEAPQMVPSTILDCMGERPVVVREGALPSDQLL